jgi:hypothetical protein
LQAAAAAGSWRTLRRIPPVEGAGASQEKLHLADVVALPDGRIWGRNGPDILIVENGRTLRRIALPVETFGGVRPGFFLDRRGRLWIPSRKLNFVEKGAIQVMDGPPPGLEQVTVVFEDRHDTLWFGLAGKGLAALPDERSLESWSEAEGLSGSVLDLATHPQLGLVAATDSGEFALDERQNRWQALGAPGKRRAFRSIAAGAGDTLVSLPHGGGLLLSTPLSGPRGNCGYHKLWNRAGCASFTGTLMANCGSVASTVCFASRPATASGGYRCPRMDSTSRT